jgi:hypothetical protein
MAVISAADYAKKMADKARQEQMNQQAKNNNVVIGPVQPTKENNYSVVPASNTPQYGGVNWYGQAKTPTAADVVKNVVNPTTTSDAKPATTTVTPDTNTVVSGTTTTTDSTPATTTTSTNNGFNANDMKTMFAELQAAQEAARLAQLRQAKERSLSALEREKTTIAPMYYDKRNEAASLSQQNARNFAEYMANRGQTNSGMSAQAEINRGNALQGSIGSLNRDEAARFADIAQRRTDIENAANDAQVQAINEIGAQYAQNMIDQANKNIGYGFQAAGLTGTMSDGTQTLAGKQYADGLKQYADAQKQRDFTNALQVAGLTGNYNGARTMQGQELDFNKGVTEAGLTGNYDGARTLQGQQFDFSKDRAIAEDERWTKQFNSQEQQRKFENDLNLNKFDFDKAVTKWQQEYETKKFDFTKAQTVIDNEFRQKQADIDNKFKAGQLSLEERKLAHSIAIDNQQLALAAAKAAASGSAKKEDKMTFEEVLGERINGLKGKSVAEVISELETNKGSYIGELGEDGFAQLHNIVLGSAIKLKQAEQYIPTEKKYKTD